MRAPLSFFRSSHCARCFPLADLSPLLPIGDHNSVDGVVAAFPEARSAITLRTAAFGAEETRTMPRLSYQLVSSPFRPVIFFSFFFLLQGTMSQNI